MTSLDDFLVSLNKEQSFKPPGELLSTYTVTQGNFVTLKPKTSIAIDKVLIIWWNFYKVEQKKTMKYTAAK